jgi:hypothetical protein
MSKPKLQAKTHRRIGGKTYLSIWATAILAAVFSTLLLANDAHNLRQMLHSFGVVIQADSTPTAPEHKEANKRPSPRISSMLYSGTLGTIETLQRITSAKTRCARLQLMNQPTPQFIDTSQSFQCTTLVFVDHAQSTASVFVQIHTDHKGEVTYFRIKFNLGSSDGQKAVEVGLHSLMQFGNFAPDVERSFSQVEIKLRDWRPFKYMAGPYRINFSGEYSDSTRFNLSGTLHRQKIDRGTALARGDRLTTD